MTLIATILRQAHARSARTALIHDNAAVTYADFAAHMLHARARLAGHAHRPGQTALILACDPFRAWILLAAAQSLGLHTAAASTLDDVPALRVLRPALLITTAEEQATLDIGIHSLAGLPVAAIPDRPTEVPTRDPTGAPASSGGHILRTSGTTGNYKHVLWATQHAETRSRRMIAARGYDSDTVFHAARFGLWTAAGYVQPPAVWAVGGTVVFDRSANDPRHFFRHAVTHATVLPPDLRALAEQAPPAPGARLFCTGGLLSHAVAQRAVARLGVALQIGYGSTECLLMLRQVFRSPEDLVWLTPYEDRVVQVVDTRGRECPAGEEGEVRVRLEEADCATYVGDPEATAQVFRDGFFHPGDLAVRRADGRIRILGRASDVVNIQGQKLSTGPIEDMLQRLTGADGACVFSGPGADGDEVVAVAIEIPRELTPDERDTIARTLPPHDRLRIVALPAFPRSRSGMRKYDRRALRRLVLEDPPP